MVSKCRNCGFVFEKSILKRYGNHYRDEVRETCPKCSSDVIFYVRRVRTNE